MLIACGGGMVEQNFVSTFATSIKDLVHKALLVLGHWCKKWPQAQEVFCA